MGLFGSRFTAQNAMDFALGGYAGLDRRRDMEQRRAQEQAKKEALAKLGGFGGIAPAQTPPVAPPVTGPEGMAAKARGADYHVTAPAPQAAAGPDWQALAQAAAAGVDVTPYLKMYEMQRPEYQGFNRDGGVQVFDQRTGDLRWVPDPQGPNAEAKRRLLEAQIAAYEAQADVRENQGDYYAAKARQPYAPKTPPRRAAAGGGTNDEPPE